MTRTSKTGLPSVASVSRDEDERATSALKTHPFEIAETVASYGTAACAQSGS